MASLSSTPYSFSPPTTWPHDVYISFTKPLDDCEDFAFSLSLSLDHAGIKTFIGDVGFLPAGKGTVSQIFKAIEQSRISVVIISENYVFSPWCLSELVKIVECRKKMYQIVLPVFYNIDPSEVRHQIGHYANSFAGRGLCDGRESRDMVERYRIAHEEVKNMYANPLVRFELCHGGDTVESWWKALDEVSNMSGFLSIHGQESRLIENIVKDIVSRLSVGTHKDLGASIFGDPRNQYIFFKCLEQVAACNGYNDVYSLSMKMSRQRPAITKWVKHEHLGEGSFASVYKASDVNGLFFVLKEPKDSRKDIMACLQHLEHEIAILAELDHENIVQYYGTEKRGEFVYIFQELVSNGSLENAYKKMNHGFLELQVSFYTQQILQGLKYLHDHNVIHRDLKCANILVNEFGNIKLADFGLAKVMHDNSLLNPDLKGSQLWMAPEVANRKRGGYDFRADIWSLGCTVVEMMTGKYPQYKAKNAWDLERAIIKGEGPIIPDYLSSNLKEFIRQCLEVDRNERPTAAELLEHSFVKESSLNRLNIGQLLLGGKYPRLLLCEK